MDRLARRLEIVASGTRRFRENNNQYRKRTKQRRWPIVGFDNERGNGDHKHVGGRESAYAFSTVETMIEDFIAGVDATRKRR